MKNLLFITLAISINSVYAESNILFPQTQAEFEQALPAPKNIHKFQPEGFEAKGFENKGVEAIREDNPIAGALILFDFDSEIIQSDSYPLLREFAQALKNGLSEAKIVIAGHTDNVGSEEYNLELSKRRAESVKNFLTGTYEIELNRLDILAFGENKPIESNETELGQTTNRRVEFIRIE